MHLANPRLTRDPGDLIPEVVRFLLVFTGTDEFLLMDGSAAHN